MEYIDLNFLCIVYVLLLETMQSLDLYRWGVECLNVVMSVNVRW